MPVGALLPGVGRRWNDRAEGLYGWPMQAWRPFGKITLQGQGL
jgi:hypothetical protein